MKLNVTTAAEGAGVPVILTHGLYGLARNLGGIARAIEGRRVLLADQRNHGDSPWSDVHDYPSLAADLAELIEAEGGQADLVGHSMGGKAAMALALLHPERLRRLVVMDIAPLAYDHSQRAYAEAMRALDLSGLKSRGEADRRFAALVDDPGMRAFFLASLDLRADPPRWKLNLDALEANMDRLTGWPDDLPAQGFTGPALFLYGTDSDYVTEAGRAAIRAAFPQAEFRALEGAGHWLHADRPRETAAAIAEFVNR